MDNEKELKVATRLVLTTHYMVFYHLFFQRTTLTFLSGIVTYLVAWAILGQDTKDNISAESSSDFTVSYGCF